VATFADHVPFTPAGKPLNVTPSAPVVVNLILFIAVPIQTVRLLLPKESKVIVLSALKFMSTVATTPPQSVPTGFTVKVPDPVGVPLIVTTSADQLAESPAGNPAKVAPVAPVVEYVIVVIASPEQSV
jgi:hypothetical protein